jgi:type I restriction enzyme S subunit
MLGTSRKITSAGLDKISAGLLPKNTVLMSSRAPAGYLALPRIPVAMNLGYIALVCEKMVTPMYAIHWLETRMDEVKSRAGGTTFAEISKTNFRDMPILVPERPAG